MFTWKEKHKLIGGGEDGQENSAMDFCRTDGFRVFGTASRRLFRGGDFFDNSFGCGARIWSGQNGAAYHNEVRAGVYSFGRGGGALLIVRACEPLLGRTPGVTIKKSRPHTLRMARASWTEATTPSTPDFCASCASCGGAIYGWPGEANLLNVASFMLVRTVTARNRGRLAPMATPALTACTAALSMALPPNA